IGKVNYNKALSTYSFIDKGTALNGSSITMQPDTEYFYCVEAARSLDEPPSFSMPSETIAAYTRADGDYPEIQLTGAYSGKLTVYPDRVYTIKANVTNAGAFRQLTYQWQKKDAKNNWNDIQNATSDTLRIMKATHETSGDYRCRIDALAKTSSLSTGVTVYTDVFTVTQKVRAVVESAFTTSCRSAKPDAAFTLRPAMSTCFVAPTGTVTFIVSGEEFEKQYTVPLKASGVNATAKLSDASDLDELYDGIYNVTAQYNGDSVFSAYTSGTKKPVLVGDSAIVPVLFNSKGERTDSFINSDTMTLKFFKYTKSSDGGTIETPCTAAEYPNGYTEVITETDGFPYGRDYSSTDDKKFIYFAKKMTKTINATVDGELQKFTYSYSVSKRPLEVGVISGEMYCGSVEGNLPQLQILSGDLAEVDALTDLVTLTYQNAAKTKNITINNYTEPGTYYAAINLTENEDRIKLYDIRLYPSEFTVNAKRYNAKITAEQCEGADAGTIKMTLPEAKSGLIRQNYLFESGTLLKLTSVANKGYYFDHWLVNGKEYYTETISVSMPRKNTEIQLFFKPYRGNLTLDKSYAVGASITEPSGFVNGTSYPVGTKFTFTANDNANYQFDHWIQVIGNLSYEYNTRSLDVTVTNADTTLYPIYTGKPCTVTLGSRFSAEYTYVNGQEETVTEKLTSGKTVPYGAVLKLTALNPESMVHYEWYVNGVKKASNQKTMNVTVNGTTDVKLVPLVETQPTDFTGSLGKNAVFTVKTNGSGVTYQWQFYSTNGWTNSTANGAQAASLTIPVTAERDGQQYRCIVRRADGVSGYTNTVSIKLKPAITKQPVSFGGQVGDVAHFSVEATGKNLTYQWQFMTTSGVWKDSGMTGAKTNALAVEVTDARDGQPYRCIVKNSNGLTETSDICRVFISPIITAQPKSFEGNVNDTAKFTIAASGKSLTYQWQFLDNGIWKNSGMAGAKTATLNVTATEARNGQQYRCVVTSSSGAQVISQAASINLRAKITANPKDQAGALGSTVAFTVTASGKNLTYQWQFKNGDTWQNSGMTGAKTNTLKVEVTEARNGQQYRCLVKAGNTAAVASSAAAMKVAAAVTEEPKDYSGALGDTAAFTVKASGIGLSYQWQFLSSSGWQNSGMAGAATASLNVEVTAARDGQQYRCIVKSANGTTAASKAVTIHATAGVTGQPQNYTGKIGDTAKFSVTAIGENLTYQWQFRSNTGWQNSGMTGADTASLNVEVTAARNGQQYRCVVTSPDGTVVTSDSAKITVK
ncbi:MAG: Ig-like domain repeat protein, partial [Oscillospiraceae bacterium]|nr:Ig-like domain repeat protein [Oscillospiraceae bacterium]